MDNKAEAEITPVTKPKGRKFSMIFTSLAVLVSMASLLISYEVAREVRQDASSTNQQIKRLSTTRDDAEQLHQQTQQSLAEQAANIKKVQEQLVTLGTSVQEIAESNATKVRQWRYSEIEYVLRLAQLNLHFQKNKAVAESLLQYADDSLKELNDAGNTTFREALNHQLTQLRGLPEIDTTGILSQLSALNQAVLTLPVLSVKISENKDQTEKPVEAAKSFWQKVVDAGSNQISHFVTIRHLDQPIKPILAQADQELLTRTLQYLLQQAEWAVTQSNAALYKQSLQDAQNLIKSHYNMGAANTTNAITQLGNLQSKTISVDLPDITGLVKQAANLRPRIKSAQEKNA